VIKVLIIRLFCAVLFISGIVVLIYGFFETADQNKWFYIGSSIFAVIIVAEVFIKERRKTKMISNEQSN